MDHAGISGCHVSILIEGSHQKSKGYSGLERGSATRIPNADIAIGTHDFRGNPKRYCRTRRLASCQFEYYAIAGSASQFGYAVQVAGRRHAEPGRYCTTICTVVAEQMSQEALCGGGSTKDHPLIVHSIQRGGHEYIVELIVQQGNSGERARGPNI